MNQEIDNQLLIDVISGNKKSHKIFVDLCNPIIWGALKNFDQLDYEDKQDLVQNIFHKEIYGKEGDWTGIKKFRGDSKFSTYLYKIITYRALDFIKSKGMKYRPKTDSVDNVRINVASAEINIDNKMTLNDALLKNISSHLDTKDLMNNSTSDFEYAGPTIWAPSEMTPQV